MESTPKNPQQPISNEYSLNSNFDINKAKELLKILAQLSNPLNQKIQNILSEENDKLVSIITDFLNHQMTKMLIKNKNLDLSSFTDILNFEQDDVQDFCNLSIKIQFI